MGQPAMDAIDAEARLAASLALYPAAHVGMQAVSAASFMRANADYVCGWKDGGLTFGRIAAKLTEMGMRATPRHVQRILAEVKEGANPKRTQAVARAIGIELMRKSAGMPTMEARPPVVAAALPAASPPAALPAVAKTHAPAAVVEPSKPVRPSRPAPPAFIESQAPLAPIGLKSVESAAMAEMAPIAGEDEDVCNDLNKAGLAMSFGEMRRSLWADVRGETRSNFATGASGARVFVLPQIQRDIFTGRISNWIDFKGALDKI